MERYELVRNDGWKLLWKNAKEFSYEDTPTAKVLSFFKKRRETDLVVTGTVAKPKEVDYTHIVEVSWLEERLNKTIRYTHKWNDYNLYQLGALQEYLDYVKLGGYTKAIISNGEMAALLPKGSPKGGKK